ncbi:MAG: outer membrane lipoprotein-sorting protein [Blastocatellia bacterium]|nr:outer membrane lipoprotein-sorting protein [Blastocatellia bacterium]
MCALSMALSACYGSMEENSDKAGSTPAAAPAKSAAAAAREGEQIIERHRALDKSSDSTTKLRAKIGEATGETHDIQLNIYRKRESDGRVLMLIEFVAPDEERDRAALLAISPDGAIQATRYAQSNDTFITTSDVAGEDSLFGMTLQELADGQPEKYDFTLAGEEAQASSPAYRVEGTLKEGAESKFPRIVMLISKESSALLGAEFYDRQNELIRRVTIDEVKQIDGHWTRMHWTIENRARQKTIDFKAVSVTYDRKLSDSLFTQEHLKNLASR